MLPVAIGLRCFCQADKIAGQESLYRLPFAALIGWLMFAELSDIWTWVGASIIFGSAFYIVRREVQLANKKKNPLPGGLEIND